MPAPEGPMAVRARPNGPGLAFVDRIEQERCECRTESPVDPRPADPERFRFPVDRAVTIEAETVSLPNVAGVLVRDSSGDIVAEVQQLDSEELPRDCYDLELLTQFKTYLGVEGPVEIEADATAFQIDFGTETEVILGARSNHERPAATVTTTSDPLDLMAAIETFGSALKTTAPDRAFPSLRGHPPAVELGSELHIPDAVEQPETEIHVELPPDLASVFVAAPLVYYLGATVEAGRTPRIRTGNGVDYALNGPAGYETTVERTLKRVFLLDCITRTEGLYGIELNERAALEGSLTLDFDALYRASPADRLAAYLEIPWSTLEEFVPNWRLTTHIEPVPKTVEQLPYVVDDLAVVRTRSTGGAEAVVASPSVPDGGFTRSVGTGAGGRDVDYIEPEATDALEQAWIGDDIPVGASKLTREAFENRLKRAPVDGDISITIVLNDPRMDEERDLADRAYGNRENLPFDVNVRRDVPTDELRDVLGSETAFLHYIGHTEREGFRCPDGTLDAGTLESTGIRSFLLNACNSYEQGLGLIEAGAVGGVVTLSDVINDGAIEVGETMARLLNAGFPLRAALTIAREESILGGQYIVAGDGGMTVAQPASGTPYLVEIRDETDAYAVDIQTYPTDVAGLGSVFKPRLDAATDYYLTSGTISGFELTGLELLQFLQLEDVPVRIDGAVRWSDEVAAELLAAGLEESSEN
ncbi:MAG: hypothetical protein ABEH64_04410 [Salinirussus sp.]